MTNVEDDQSIPHLQHKTHFGICQRFDKFHFLSDTVNGKSGTVRFCAAVAQTYHRMSGMYHCARIRPKRYLPVGGQSYHDTTRWRRAAREVTIMKKFWN